MIYVALTLSLIGLFGIFHHRAERLRAERSWSGEVRSGGLTTEAEVALLLAAAQLATAGSTEQRSPASIFERSSSDADSVLHWQFDDRDNAEGATPTLTAFIVPTM